MNAPLVSVLIPVRDGEAMIAETLKSVFGQSHPRLQVVVVDNGSSDRTVELVRECFAGAPCDCILAECPEPGANRARNMAYTLAEGEFVQWLDADDQLHEDKIERQLTALAETPDADIAVGDWIWRVQLGELTQQQVSSLLQQLNLAAAWGVPKWQRRGSEAQRAFAQPSDHDFLLRLLEDKWSPPHSYLLRRAAAQQLHEVQAWHPSARVCMDREYFSSAAVLGMTFLSVSGAWSRYNYWSGTQISRQADGYARAAALHACFKRLRAIEGPLGGIYEELLSQSHALWRLQREPLEAYRKNASSPLEQAVAAALQGPSGAGSLELWAKLATIRAPQLWERHAEVLQVLTQMAKQGVLTTEWDPSTP